MEQGKGLARSIFGVKLLVIRVETSMRIIVLGLFFLVISCSRQIPQAPVSSLPQSSNLQAPVVKDLPKKIYCGSPPYETNHRRHLHQTTDGYEL